MDRWQPGHDGQQPGIVPAGVRDADPSPTQRKLGFWWYYVFNLLATGCLSAIAVVAWSTSMGVGKTTFQKLEELSWLMYMFLAMCCGVLLLLYLMDFFHPPHLPGQSFCLWDGDRHVGRGLLVLSSLFLTFAVLLMTPTYPGIPVVITTIYVPISALVVNALARPAANLPNASEMRDIVENGDLTVKIALLRDMVGNEKDQLAFYKAATAACFTSFVIILPLWIYFAVVLDMGKAGLEDASADERDKIYIQWATPLLVAVSNFVFTLFGLLRVFMQRSYCATNVFRNRLLVAALRSPNQVEVGKFASKRTQENLECVDDAELVNTMHVQHMKQLSMLVKVVGCTFVLVIGALYVVGQLLYANSGIAMMALALLAAFFLCYVLFVSVAFSRVLYALGQWLRDMPAWKAMHSVAAWPATRAAFVCILLPVIPLVLLLSFLTQLVRRCRGIDRVHPPVTIEESFGLNTSHADQPHPEPPPIPNSQHFTIRIASMMQMVAQWDFIAVAFWCYLLCGLYVLYNVFPLMLNVGLSWLRSVTATWPFGVILASTFFIGVVAFLLPPVPGLTVYIFGGLVVSGTCPWGFWAGTVVNVGMCWFLKLFACAIQQVCIGGLLGRSLWVRRTARVHQVAIRCIEAELRQKGLRLGKVAILCGGPDWPTSVLAGVLGLSLWECELGTVPIIGFVAPCALTGSLYIRKDEGPIWARSADLMIVASVVVNLLLWALAFWAIQNRLEADYEQLNRQLPENVDLHWVDYREEEIAKRATTTWGGTPVCVRNIFLLGAAIHIFVCDGLSFGYSYLFGSFAVQDDISTLVWFPGEGVSNELFTWMGVGVLGVYMATTVCYLQYSLWRHCKLAAPRRKAQEDLDASEATWKQEFLARLAREDDERKGHFAKKSLSSDELPENPSEGDEAMIESTIYVVPQEFAPAEQIDDDSKIVGRCSLAKPVMSPCVKASAWSAKVKASGGSVQGLQSGGKDFQICGLDRQESTTKLEACLGTDLFGCCRVK